MRESTNSAGWPTTVRFLPSSVWEQSARPPVTTVTVVTHPVTTSIDGMQPAEFKFTTHSPTARVVGSTEGGGSFVWTGIWKVGT